MSKYHGGSWFHGIRRSRNLKLRAAGYRVTRRCDNARKYADIGIFIHLNSYVNFCFFFSSTQLYTFDVPTSRFASWYCFDRGAGKARERVEIKISLSHPRNTEHISYLLWIRLSSIYFVCLVVSEVNILSCSSNKRNIALDILFKESYHYWPVSVAVIYKYARAPMIRTYLKNNGTEWKFQTKHKHLMAEGRSSGSRICKIFQFKYK